MVLCRRQVNAPKAKPAIAPTTNKTLVCVSCSPIAAVHSANPARPDAARCCGMRGIDPRGMVCSDRRRRPRFARQQPNLAAIPLS